MVGAGSEEEGGDCGRPVASGPGHAARGPTAAEVRLARQKAALKANMARRKAKLRASVAQDPGQDGPASGPQDGTGNEQE